MNEYAWRFDQAWADTTDRHDQVWFGNDGFLARVAEAYNSTLLSQFSAKRQVLHLCLLRIAGTS